MRLVFSLVPWDLIVIVVGGIVLSVAIGVGRGMSEEWRGRRAVRAAGTGAFVSRPMRLVTGDGAPWGLRALGVESGRAYRDGEDLVVLRTGGPARIRLADLSTAGARTTVDEDSEAVRDVFALADANGRPYELQVPDYVSPGLAAVTSTPPRPASVGDRFRSAVPWRLVLVALVVGVPFAVHQAAWHTGHDVDATVRAVEVDGYCTVTWTEDGRSHEAGVDCYEPYPAVGDTLLIRAMSGPLTGQAMDHAGSYDAGLVLLGGPVVALLVAAVVGTGLRLRGGGLRLSVPAGVASATGAGASPSSRLPEQMTLREFALAVAEREGWAFGSFGTGHRLSPVRRILLAAVWWPMYVVGGALFVAWLWEEEVPQPYTWPLTVVAAGALGYAALATSRTLQHLLEPAGDVPERPVDALTVRTLEDEWVVLLFEPDAVDPTWLLTFPAEAHPPLTARAVLRGVPEDGRAGWLVIDGHTWEPIGPLGEIDDETRRDIREDLRGRLEVPVGTAWWDGLQGPGSSDD